MRRSLPNCNAPRCHSYEEDGKKPDLQQRSSHHGKLSQVFCLEHRTYSKHQCPHGNEHDITVLVCPMCAKGVRLVPNEDPNITWESHVNKDCDPSNYEKVMKKPRCPAPGCKEILSFSNKVKCRDCMQDICLKHRFGPDHKCPGPKKVDGNFFLSGMFGTSRKEKAVSGGRANSCSSSSSSQSLRSSFFAAASNIRASAEAGMTKLSSATNEVLNRVKVSTTPMQQPQDQSRQSTSMEECPRCGARFSSVVSLVQHVQNFHESQHQGGTQELLDVCPKCGRVFRDPVSLVNHVDRDHGGASTY